jgi:ribonucleotide reductase beta subunit family protein with ferritin-like domain
MKPVKRSRTEARLASILSDCNFKENDENPYRWIAITQDGANGQVKAIQNSRQAV